MNIEKKHKKWVLLVQVFLILGSAALLYSKLNDGAFIAGIKNSVASISIWHFLTLIFLSICFWVLDTTVWRWIMKPFAQIHFKEALRFNVVAQSAGILTPFLVGDYGLRSVLLRNHIDPRQNTLVTLAYQLLKVFTRVAIGVLAAIVLSSEISWGWILILFAAALLVLGVVSIKQFIRGIGKSKYTQQLLGMGDRLDFTQLNMLKAMLPAIVLFLTFCLQTSLLIFWIDDTSPLHMVLLWVVLTYSVTSFLPPLSFFDPLAKSAFGALLGGQFASPEAILVSFSLTWIINRGLPALFSSLFFRRLSGVHQSTSSST